MKIKKQIDIKECGLVVIQSMIHHFYEKMPQINNLKKMAKYGHNGINISNMILLGKQNGLEIESFKVDFKILQEEIKNEYFITILSLNGENHYVIAKFKHNAIIIFDPIEGKRKLSFNDFQEFYTGIILTVEKSINKYKPINIKNTFKFYLKQPAIISWILTSVIFGIIFTLTSSLYMKIIIDTVIPSFSGKTLLVISLLFIWLAIIKVLNSFFKNFFLMKLKNNIEIQINYNFFKKIRTAPFQQLNKIHQNDYLRRMSLIGNSSNFIAQTFFTFFHDLILFTIVVGVIIGIDPKLFGIAFSGGMIIAFITIVIQLFLRTKYDGIINADLENTSSSMTIINSIDNLKMDKSVKYISKIQQEKYIKLQKRNWSVWKIKSIDSIINSIIYAVLPILIVYIFTNDIFHNGKTLGTMIMFMSLLSFFLDPIEDFAAFFLGWKQSWKYIEMLEFVLNFKEEKVNSKGVVFQRVKRIELKDIDFGYDRNLFYIPSIDLTENMHLEGPNGAGKSSLIKIFALQYLFKEKVKINNIESQYIAIDDFREKTFISRPNIFLFNSNILEYVTLNNRAAKKILFNNLQKYNLFPILSEMKLDLNASIVNNGSNLSSGQKQIISILRLLTFPYNLIIIDEGLENIDKNKVKQLSQAVTDFQKDALFVEVSHSKKYLSKGQEVNINELVKSH